MFYSRAACLLSPFFILIFNFFPGKSLAVGPFAGPNYKVYKLGYLEGSFQMERFLTEANFDNKGNTTSLGTTYTNYLRSYDYTYKGRLTYTSNFALSGGINTRSVDTDNGLLVRSRTGVGEVFLGADYRWQLGETDIILDYKATYSPYRTPDADNTDHPIWGDSANSAQTILILQRKFGTVLGYGFGGYNYRDNGLSDYYILGLGTQWALGGWVIGGELKGSLLGDPDIYYSSEKSGRHDQLKDVNAGSFKYYSTNPEWISAEFNFKYRLTTQFAFNAGGGTIFKGYNIADGNFWYLGLQLQWPVFMQELTGRADVQKKEPEFIPDIPSSKRKTEESSRNNKTEGNNNATEDEVISD
jgi:hypothetical protein